MSGRTQGPLPLCYFIAEREQSHKKENRQNNCQQLLTRIMYLLTEGDLTPLLALNRKKNKLHLQPITKCPKMLIRYFYVTHFLMKK